MLRAWKQVIVAGLLGALAMPCFAGNTTLDWQAPTGQETCTNVDTAPVLASYNIYQLIATVNDPAQLSYEITGLKPGTYTYVATAVDTEGRESRMSGQTKKEITTFQTISTTVYTMITTELQTIALIAVGIVNLGVACDVNQSVNGHYRVPLTEVTFTGDTEPFIVFGKCQ